MSRVVRIGVMGCADIAWRHVLPAIQGIPEYEIRAVASRTLPKARRFTDCFGGIPLEGYESLVNRDDVDAVYVPLPTGLHPVWVTKLLAAGKHVMVEKSLATDFTTAAGLIALAEQNQRVLMEHFQFLHHSQTEFVREKLQSGIIGDIRIVRASFGFPPLPRENFRYIASLGGGALLDAGAYTLRASQEWLGPELRVLGAYMNKSDATDVDLHGAALLAAPNGAVAQIAWGFDHFYQCTVELWGQKGRILQTRAFTAPPGFNPTVFVDLQGKKTEYLLSTDNHFIKLWRAFYGKILQSPAYDATAELTQARLLDEIRQAAGWNVS